MDTFQSRVRTRRFTIRLWAPVIGPPVVWAVRFMATYGLSPLACAADAIILLHGITALSVVVTGSLGWLSWRYRNAARDALEAHPDDDVLMRVHSMALFGIMSAALFALVILAEGLANVMIDPCLTSGPLVPH